MDCAVGHPFVLRIPLQIRKHSSNMHFDLHLLYFEFDYLYRPAVRRRSLPIPEFVSTLEFCIFSKVFLERQIEMKLSTVEVALPRFQRFRCLSRLIGWPLIGWFLIRHLAVEH